MSELRELYQSLIIDHGRSPRNFRVCDTANHIKEGYNPLCGDQLTIYLTEKNGVIEDICFKGEGCAISMASTSMMTEALKGKTAAYVESLFDQFHRVVTGDEMDTDSLGKLAVLSGVSEFPARVKCATLAWHTLKAAMDDDPSAVSTE